jgi:hypothetical protein
MAVEYMPRPSLVCACERLGSRSSQVNVAYRVEKTLAGTVRLSAENTVWHAVFWQEPLGTPEWVRMANAVLDGRLEPRASQGSQGTHQ